VCHFNKNTEKAAAAVERLLDAEWQGWLYITEKDGTFQNISFERIMRL
jgi:hypothetical protein